MNALSDELPFWHFDEDLMVYRDGSLGGAFKLTGFDISCLMPEEINRFTRNLESLLVSANDGTRIQIFHKLLPNLERVITEHVKMAESAPEVYKPIVEARSKLLHENLKQKHYYLPEIYIFIRSKAFSYKKQGLFEKSTEYRKVTDAQYKEHKEKFERILRQIESSLRTTQLNPLRLSQKKWFDVCFEFLNLERSETIGSPSLREGSDFFSESVNSQQCLTDIRAGKDWIEQGGYKFRAITLKTLPEGQSYASMIDGFTKLPFHFWISQSIEVLDQGKERQKLELQRRVAHSMAAGSKNVSDLDSQNKLSNIESLLSELLEGSLKLLAQSFTVIVWGTCKEELDEKCDEVLKAFRGLNQSEALVESIAGKDAFFKALPGACTGFRNKKMKSDNISHFMPMFSNWEGNKKPVCLLPNRDNGLCSIDLFNRELQAWNGICFGGTGSGKSFTISQLCMMFYGQKPTPRIIWIDNGASSKRLLEVLDGEFLDFNLESGMCINMFDLPSGQIKPGPEKVKMVLAVLEMILKDEDKPGIPKRQKALLEEAIYKIYRKTSGQIPTLSTLKEYLAVHEVLEMRTYAEILYSWTGDTAYGKVLDGQTNVKLSRDLVTIEVQSLNDHSELKNAVLLLLTSYIQETSTADFKRPYLLIVDEAERLFQTEMARQFVITCYRTWRKFNSAIWCLSQNYKDFMQDKNLRDSLMPNTSHTIILRQRKIDWEDFQKTFDFTDAQVEVIKSLQVVKGKYSEFFYMQDEYQTVLRLVPEPLSYWICTSDGNDKARIAEMEQKYPEAEKIKILQYLAFGEPTGNELPAAAS